MPRPSLVILADYSRSDANHQATEAAIAHANAALGTRVEFAWVDTEAIDSTIFEMHTGIWVTTGSPYRSMANVLWAIEHARKHNIPCLGTCGGMQHMVLEYARNVLGIKNAAHAEYDPCASQAFISRLQCSSAGRQVNIRLNTGSQVAAIYERTAVEEECHCNCGVHPGKVEKLRSGPLEIAGSGDDGEVRVIELPTHPFFIGTLFV